VAKKKRKGPAALTGAGGLAVDGLVQKIITPEEGMVWSARGDDDDDRRPDLRVYGDKTPGKPGRPSSANIFKREAEDRLRRGELPKEQTLVAFCRALLKWFNEKHPSLPAPKLRPLTNIIRPVWKKYMH
jgi:hypothetical protein